MTSFSRLIDALGQKMRPLPSKAKSLFFALSAYRSFPIYEYFSKVTKAGDPILLKVTLDDVFEHAANDLRVNPVLFRQWHEITLQLYPEEHVSVLGPPAGDVAIAVDAASNALAAGEWL